MKSSQYTSESKLWLYPGKAGWHFLTIPKKLSTEINKKYTKKKAGWGSLPVTAHIGKSIWSTSIFPDSESGTFLLPIKAKVRQSEGLSLGDKISFVIEVQVKN